jgi:murein DD-endopeptidase MepM/ murein hydrolase activator NlpD
MAKITSKPAFISISSLLIGAFILSRFFLSHRPAENQERQFCCGTIAIYSLINEHTVPLEVWGIPISFDMTFRQYTVQENDNFWAIIEREKLEIPSEFKAELLKYDSKVAKILAKIQPRETLSFIIGRNNELTDLLLHKQGQDLLIAQKEVRPVLGQEESMPQSYRYDIKIQRSLSYDLAQHRIPTNIKKELIEALGTRFNLMKEVYKDSRLTFFYGRNNEGQWQLYKFFFHNGKKSLCAYSYKFDGALFVDDGGMPLKKGFLEKPVEHSYISSHFTQARKHPVLGTIRAHKGVDFAAPKGSPVRASCDGVIVFVGSKGGYGNLIEIDHKNGIQTRYAHLDRFSSDIKKGLFVERGHIIGFVGMTGLATGPHLHYEYLLDGVAMDPLKAPEAFCRKLPSHDAISFEKIKKYYDALEKS